MSITLRYGVLQPCTQEPVSIAYDYAGHRFGLRIRGCGGPYRFGREVPARALRSLRSASEGGLPIDSAQLLAQLQRDTESGIVRLILEGQIEREEGERFLEEVFP